MRPATATDWLPPGSRPDGRTSAPRKPNAVAFDGVGTLSDFDQHQSLAVASRPTTNWANAARSCLRIAAKNKKTHALEVVSFSSRPRLPNQTNSCLLRWVTRPRLASRSVRFEAASLQVARFFRF